MARYPSAILFAGDIVVTCPHCGAEQPSPGNGSDRWLTEEVAANQGRRMCVSCDLFYQLNFHAKVAVEPTAAKPR